MNLQEEMRKRIDYHVSKDAYTDIEMDATDREDASKECAEIAERNAIEFMKWFCPDNADVEKLYQLFLNSKNNVRI